MRIAGVYLAAGAGRRMNGAKLTAELLPGVPLGAVALKALLAVGLDAAYIVVRPGDPLDWLPEPVRVGALRRKGAREAGRSEGEAAIPRTKAEVVVCADAGRGMAHSLRCGVGCAMSDGCDAAVVVLADQPFVTAGMMRGLVDCWRSDPRLDYVASGDGGAIMPPVLLAGATFQDVARLEGDRGAKRLLERPDWAGRVIPAEEPERLMDVDTPDLMERARRYSRGHCVRLNDI
ncbi:nucleotidyltransferase family protein [Cohnella zeiphila]|uniref:Nucleotidyltransferase family protein n=1 Tax=Cohnella zeiphila TaxID=2761120 RepID=A0A7X0SL54_9BACL|nr:nucleotidyltransferase family protein [Cohnella zeiphila]MBB6732027.1 nucleotidyltransferase family protein [Cohnella zeiphila]